MAHGAQKCWEPLYQANGHFFSAHFNFRRANELHKLYERRNERESLAVQVWHGTVTTRHRFISYASVDPRTTSSSLVVTGGHTAHNAMHTHQPLHMHACKLATVSASCISCKRSTARIRCSPTLLSGTTWASRYQKGKTNLDFTEARDSEWQWHQLDHMQVCTSLQTNNHASTPPLKFFTGRMPFLHAQPTASKR